MQGPRVQFLVGELRSYMPCGTAKEKSTMVNNVVEQQKTLQKSKLMQRTNLWLQSGKQCGGRINYGFGISRLFLLLFSHSVVSHSLQLHGLQHTRLPLSFTISQSLLKFVSTESVMPSNHLILCHPLLLLPSIFF